MTSEIEQLKTQIDALEKQKLALDKDITILDDDNVKQNIAEIKLQFSLEDIPIEEKTEIEKLEKMIQKIETTTDINIILEDTDIIDTYNRIQTTTNTVADRKKIKKIFMDQLNNLEKEIKDKTNTMVVAPPSDAIVGPTGKSVAEAWLKRINDHVSDIITKIDLMINSIPNKDQQTIIKNEIDLETTPPNTDPAIMHYQKLIGKGSTSVTPFCCSYKRDGNAITSLEAKQFTYGEIKTEIPKFIQVMGVHIAQKNIPATTKEKILACKSNTLDQLKILFDKIVDKIKTKAESAIDEYIEKKITGRMTGGGLFDFIVILFRKYLLELYYNSYRMLLTNRINDLTTRLNQLIAESAIADITPIIDYVTPLKILLQYRVGAPTDIDVKLITYCLSVGLSQETSLSIYFAETKSDIIALLQASRIAYNTVQMNILRLKKLSAYKKFLRDYQVSESQIGLLYSHRQLYV